MKYTVRVDGREVALDVLEKGEGIRIRAGEREIPAEFRRIRGDGAWTLRLGDRTHCVVVVGGGEGETVTVGNRTYSVAVEDEREAAAHSVRGPRDSGPRVLRSAMPGIVREVHVAEGERVEARAPLLVLEAMKMQNEVRADRPGRVAKVHVAPGSTVARGDPLVTLE